MKTKPLALIVDDNADVREVVEECVAELGHDFHSVGSQSEARERMDLHAYDYILLDARRAFAAGTA